MLKQLKLLPKIPIIKTILNQFYKSIGDKLTKKAVNLLP